MKLLPEIPALKIIIGMAIALAIYFTLMGSMIAGGGFAAGIMLAIAYAIAFFSFGQSNICRVCDAPRLMLITATGLALFVLLALCAAGTTGSGMFLGESLVFSAQLSAIASNTAIMLTFGGGISLIITTFVTYTPEEPGL